MSDKTILISEIFGPVAQGEGMHIGKPTVFIRTGGCDYKCSWCDTLYAVLPMFHDGWVPMTAEAIVDRVHDLTPTPILITLSGGNPAMQRNMGEVIELLHIDAHTVTIETQGSVLPDWAGILDSITLSPKPPSSMMTTDFAQLNKWIYGVAESVTTVLKIVVFGEEDYIYAKDMHRRYPHLQMFLQVGNVLLGDAERMTQINTLLGGLAWLQQTVIEDGWYDVTVLPQLHVLLHGNKRGT